MKRTIGLSTAAAAVTALALVQSGAAGPGSLGSLFFGPKLVRAEVVLAEGGGLTDYRIDRGRIRAVAAGSISLLERDGTLVTVPVSPAAEVRLRGRTVPLSRLRRGLVATTIRSGDQPATVVQVGS